MYSLCLKFIHYRFHITYDILHSYIKYVTVNGYPLSPSHGRKRYCKGERNLTCVHVGFWTPSDFEINYFDIKRRGRYLEAMFHFLPPKIHVILNQSKIVNVIKNRKREIVTKGTNVLAEIQGQRPNMDTHNKEHKVTKIIHTE